MVRVFNATCTSLYRICQWHHAPPLTVQCSLAPRELQCGPGESSNPWCSRHVGWSSAQAKRTCKVKPSIWCWNCSGDQWSPPTTPLALACAHPTFGGLEDWNGAKPTLIYCTRLSVTWVYARGWIVSLIHTTCLFLSHLELFLQALGNNNWPSS
jgi:hypothetical protein